MESLLDVLCVLVMVLNFVTLGASRVRAVIQVVALQGLLVGVMPLLVHEHPNWRAVIMAAATIATKAIVIPRLLVRLVRDAGPPRGVESLVGLTRSLLIGAAGTVLVLQFSGHLPLDARHSGSMVVPASLATVLAGFIVLTTRVRGVMQVLGYLVLENGIYVFGVLLLESMPALVEMGALLDLFVGVFIMGILLGHLNREAIAADGKMTGRSAKLTGRSIKQTVESAKPTDGSVGSGGAPQAEPSPVL
jgi:hydrogenase-4 component E